MILFLIIIFFEPLFVEYNNPKTFKKTFKIHTTSLYKNRIYYISRIQIQLSKHIEQLSLIWTLLGIYLQQKYIYAINDIIN